MVLITAPVEITKTFNINQVEWKIANSIPNAMEIFALGGRNWEISIRQIGSGRGAIYQAKTVESLELNGNVSDAINILEEVRSRISDAELTIHGGRQSYGHNDYFYTVSVTATGWTTLTPDQVVAMKAIKVAMKEAKAKR